MGRADWVGAEAIGVPGQRTFRLMVLTASSSAQVWMEKELLQNLAAKIGQLLAQIDAASGDALQSSLPPNLIPKPPNFPPNPEIDFHAVNLGLRYDQERDLIALEAFDQETVEEREPDEAQRDQPPTLRCLTTREQMEALQANSVEVVAAGRPRCPLCGTALSTQGMPHFCPPTNGHQKLIADEDEPE
jgi:uncharacterized repeat protein (TIGR03847 family)